jgi:SAM-dependent methyltransferase
VSNGEKNGRIEGGEVHFGRTADDYARHRAGFPDDLQDRLAAHGLGRSGLKVLDLGTGTGSLGRLFARRRAAVVGLDRSPELMGQARRLDEAEGLVSAYVAGRAEETPFADASFDLVAAGQCWHWFDRPRAAAEARRLLVPGGRLAICHFDWIPLPGNLVAATEALIERHNPAWTFGGGTGLHPAWFADAANAGFEAIESFSYDQPVPYSHAAWRGRIRASAGVGASLAPEAVAAFDRALADLLAARFPEEPLQVPHRVFAIVARAP